MRTFSRGGTLSFLCACFAVAACLAAPVLAAGTPASAVATPDGKALLISARFSAPVFSPADGVESVQVDGLPVFAEAAGHPRLPVSLVTVVLPPGTRAAGLSVEGTVAPVAGVHRLSWGQHPTPIGKAAPSPAGPDPAIYGSAEVYPDVAAQLVGQGTLHGYTVATLKLWPLQYRADRGQLLAWSAMSVRLTLVASAKAEDSLPPRGLLADRAALARVAINPEAASAYGSTKGSDADEPYLIICPEILESAFTRLLDHRAAHGMPGRILTTEWVLANHSGVDNAEKVRDAIRDAYTTRGTSFVLLGGDDVDDSGALLVPYRGCLLDAGGYRYENAPVDFYFGALDGSWNADGDGVWCEPEEIDYYSEVHIGRANVDTATEANRFIDKVIAYEGGLPDARRTDLVWIGESLDAQTWGGDSKDVTAGLIDEADYDISRLYERDGTYSKNAVIEALNRGPHLTNHLGHASASYVMGIYRSDVDALTNETPFFSYSQGCDSGAWDQGFSGNSEAISEHFITAQHAGFAVVMNARYGWYEGGSTNGPSQYLDHEFYDALFTEGLTTLGEANDDSRHDNATVAQSDPYRRWCFLETNLHGDPATPVQVGAKLKLVSQRVIEEDPLHGNGNLMADPGETIRIAITLENLSDQAATAVEAFLIPLGDGITVHDHWAAWEDIPGRGQGENLAPHFTATLDLPCGLFAEFSLEIHYDDGEVTTGSFSLLLGERIEARLFGDDFEDNQGWTTGGDCADGEWVREAPQGTTHGSEAANPDEDASPDPGSSCYVTGNDGLAADDDDVDRGTAILTSPELDATGWLELDLRYSRWFYVAPRTTPPSNTLKIEVSDDGGANWKPVETIAGCENAWTDRVFSLEGLVSLGPGLQMRMIAEDMEGAMMDVIVEAGLDEVVFEGIRAECTSFSPSANLPPRPVGNTLLVHRSGSHLHLEWQPCDGDGSHDPATFYRVERSPSNEDPFETLAETVCASYVDRDAANESTFLQYLSTARNEAGDETP